MGNQDGPGDKDNRGSQYVERESNKRGQRWGKKVKEMAPELPWFLMTFQFQSLGMPAWATQFLSWFPRHDNDKSVSPFIFKYTILRPQYLGEVIYYPS